MTPIFLREFEFIGIAFFDFFHPDQFDAGALRCTIDQRTVKLCLRSCFLQLLRRIGFNFAPVKKRPELPTLGAVKHLHGSLTIELKFKAHLAWTC